MPWTCPAHRGAPRLTPPGQPASLIFTRSRLSELVLMSQAHRFTVLEWLLVGLVPLFAFAAASFAVRNSDFWLHLAAGRELAAGRYAFGVDPFAYTTEGVYWANHAWLFDLSAYLLFQAVGGAGLV